MAGGVASSQDRPRTWPAMLFSTLSPFTVGLALHALVTVDRWMLFWAVLVGGLTVLVGGLPIARGAGARHGGPDASSGNHWANRRLFGLFALLAAVTTLVWPILFLRLVLSIVSAGVGVAFLAFMGRVAMARSAEPDRITAILIPWCYTFGPAGAITLLVLAMRPTQLGSLHEFVYLGLGRVAAFAGLLFWFLVERMLRQRARRSGSRISDTYLPFRLTMLIVAVTGFLVPGGGSVFAFFWALGWLVLAVHERRLSLS